MINRGKLFFFIVKAIAIKKLVPREISLMVELLFYTQLVCVQVTYFLGGKINKILIFYSESLFLNVRSERYRLFIFIWPP